MLLWFIITFLFSLAAFADCQIGGKNLRDGETVSLFESGKSLSTQKTQDQDGLGTCYANSTSAILKSVLPGQPDISYIHAAIENSADKQVVGNASVRYVPNVVEEKFIPFVNGGHVCQTIEALKKNGGACRITGSLLESQDLIEGDLQERLFVGLGRYFDAFNGSRKQPGQAKKFREDMALASEQIAFIVSSVKSRCEAIKKEEIPMEAGISELLGYFIMDHQDDSACSKTVMENIRKYLATESVVANDRVQVRPNESLLSIFRQKFLEDSGMKQRILSEIGDSLPSKQFSGEVGRVIGSIFKEISTKSTAPECLIANLPDQRQRKKHDNPDKNGDSFLDYIMVGKNRNCDDFLSNSSDIFSEIQRNNQCIAPSNLEIFQNALEPLLLVGYEFSPELMQGMMNSNGIDADQLKRLIVPGCMNSNERVDVSKVNCQSFSPCNGDYSTNPDNIKEQPQRGGECFELSVAMEQVQNKVFKGVSENRALGVNVCTGFLNDLSKRSNYCKEMENAVAKHSYHAMALSGYRCHQGKLQYEIINSWGNQFCPKSSSDSPGASVHCEKNENGERTGRFWVNEEVLVDSMTTLNEVSVKER